LQILLCLLIAISSAGTATSILAAPPARDHPILGKWEFTMPNGRCSEIYHFRSDGTELFTGADQMGESAFEISAVESSRGFYKLIDTITKHNGKKDCTGQVAKIGNKMTVFVRMRLSGDTFMMCRDESTVSCIGPFKRLR